MTVKSKSLLGKTLIVVVSYALCVLRLVEVNRQAVSEETEDA